MKFLTILLILALVLTGTQAFKAQFKKHHNKLMAGFHSSKSLTKLYGAQFDIKNAEYKKHMQATSEEEDEFQACMMDGIQNKCGSEVTGDNADEITQQAQELEQVADSLEYDENGDMTSESVDELQAKLESLENDPDTGDFWSCTFSVVTDCAEEEY
ncbi:hypothetical protein PPERSA_08887 [Pseudocohnilembus persalinus]|uniref:Uncharacterized protein n=1 Tax=Pseudocohnilembus persalinus TaxID=266149 RepID=A0A0V0QE74_PSEPJ|nr:hypothetical protein PPERSA_08887 [Pseudocohnilembus persalinus]|eukprot:KRX00494.1 hypothetical protein PPERSA_08887 [Pseudocohnilembus persalinus]